MPEIRLTRPFFARDTHLVARELLGKVLVRKWRGKTLAGRIVDVESYVGEDDLACHASKGRTPRNDVMYGPAGHAYIYFIYGMYHLMNIVTERPGFPAAVLLRGLEPLSGIDLMQRWRGTAKTRDLTNGPGKLTRALRIDQSLKHEDLTASRRFYLIDDGFRVRRADIAVGPRIGIDYARHCVHYPWRYYLKNSPFVSKK